MTGARDARLTRLKRLAWLMDDSIRVPVIGRRIGIESLLGLVPVVGDLAGGGISAYVLYNAARMGASVPTLLRMAFNIALEMVVGAVPVLGDLFDMGFKANQRNVRLLERHVGDSRSVDRQSFALVAAALTGLALLLIGAALATIWVTVVSIRWLVGRF